MLQYRQNHCDGYAAIVALVIGFVIYVHDCVIHWAQPGIWPPLMRRAFFAALLINHLPHIAQEVLNALA